MPQSSDPLPFELRSLEVFLSVCDCGTMSSAARILGLTQSAVSQTIAELEQRVNANLFDRNVRPLGLTVSGVLLRQRASALIADARQIAPLLRDVRRNKLPLIRVGLVDSFSRLLVPDLPNHLSRFADHVSFVSGLTSSHVDDLLGRKLDILLGVDEFEALDGLESWPLLEEPYVIIAPPQSPAPATVAELAELGRKLKFVRYHPRRKIGVSIERHLRRTGRRTPARLRIRHAFRRLRDRREGRVVGDHDSALHLRIGRAGAEFRLPAAAWARVQATAVAHIPGSRARACAA